MEDRLSLSEWIVLCLVAESPTHGFALVRLTSGGGAVGRVWRLPKPVVYRAVDRLIARALVVGAGTEPGDSGPPRALVQTTPQGRAAVGEWLGEPARHVRDVRSELLVKLALLERRGGDPAPLLSGQQRVLNRIVAGLEAQLSGSDGFDRVLLTFRLENARAAVAFVETTLGGRALAGTGE
ncbi:MAG TPA: PadR family transcriptional regulator [Amycolatopsis sp.]|nr:PadR family transcriptional regulator [Amycolatopsis sp.]